jgi:hypothetical protein
LLSRRMPKYSDWGWGVTVCLAVICNKSKSIICVSDEKVDYGEFAADSAAQKTQHFDRDCMVLYAGNDAEYAPLIIDAARDRFHEDKRSRNPHIAARYIHEAYCECLQNQIESRVLKRYGFTLSSFQKNGKRLLTPEVFAVLFQKIEQIRLSLQFLICGFKQHQKRYEAQILSVNGLTPPVSHEAVGMWAIGSGTSLALSSLSFAADKRGLGRRSPLALGLYSALAAKFMAESNSQVGRTTWFIVLSPNRLRSMNDNYIKQVKTAWEKHGTPKIPKEIVKKIPNFLWGLRWYKRKPKAKAGRKIHENI